MTQLRQSHHPHTLTRPPSPLEDVFWEVPLARVTAPSISPVTPRKKEALRSGGPEGPLPSPSHMGARIGMLIKKASAQLLKRGGWPVAAHTEEPAVLLPTPLRVRSLGASETSDARYTWRKRVRVSEGRTRAGPGAFGVQSGLGATSSRRKVLKLGSPGRRPQHQLGRCPSPLPTGAEVGVGPGLCAWTGPPHDPAARG